MRHMDGVKGNFVLHDDREYFLPFFVGKLEEPESRNALYCTQKEMVEAHLFMFENLLRFSEYPGIGNRITTVYFYYLALSGVISLWYNPR